MGSFLRICFCGDTSVRVSLARHEAHKPISTEQNTPGTSKQSNSRALSLFLCDCPFSLIFWIYIAPIITLSLGGVNWNEGKNAVSANKPQEGPPQHLMLLWPQTQITQSKTRGWKKIIPPTGDAAGKSVSLFLIRNLCCAWRLKLKDKIFFVTWQRSLLPHFIFQLISRAEQMFDAEKGIYKKSKG